MQALATDWLRCFVECTDTVQRRGAVRFALRLSVQTVILANLFNTAAHVVLDAFGLLSYPLAQVLPVAFLTASSITFVLTMFVGVIFGRAVLELSIQRDAFEYLSSTDTLSDVRNRRSFFEGFELSREPGQLILIDVDRFKAINDDYGHLAGDDVIRGIGRTLKAALERSPAIIGRIGGEEFAVFLPGADAAADRDPAERIRVAVSAMTVQGVERPVTISLGVASTRPPRPVIEVYSAADRALYLAKTSGRNRVVHEAEICGLAVPPKPNAAPREAEPSEGLVRAEGRIAAAS